MSVAAWLFVFRFLVPLFGGMLAMVTDIRERRIPNGLSVSICVSGLVYRTATGGWTGCLDSLAGFAVGFAVLFVLYAIGGGGAGDVKFMAAVGSWLGPYHILFVFVLSAIVLALFSFLVLFWRLCRGKTVTKPLDSTNSESGLKSSPILRTRLPYAVPATIAIGIRLAWLLLIGRTT
jgi:prepilin peptidase CpaA